MSSFNPTTRIVTAADEPDRLAGGLLNSLTRPIYRPLAWGIVRSFLFAALTFGFLPLILMTRWLRKFVGSQQQQLWHLAEWMRLQTGDTDYLELQKSAEKIRFSNLLALLATLCLLAAAGAATMHFVAIGPPFRIEWLYRWAYHMPATPHAVIFTFSLSAAAACHWTHLALHQQNVERYLRWFNMLATRQGLEEVPLPKLELGLRPVWIVAALILAVGGALWALPVMLAAGAHHRYIRTGSLQMRIRLAERLREMLLARKPALRVPKPIVATQMCVRPNCRAPMPSSAKFCPRCGTRVWSKMNVVA